MPPPHHHHTHTRTPCRHPASQALEDSRLSKAEIHDIVLVGGSTRIPKASPRIRLLAKLDVTG